MKLKSMSLTIKRVPSLAHPTKRIRQQRHAYALIFAVLLMLAALGGPSAQAQTFTSLYSFKGSPGGSEPAAGLTADSKGNFYGTTVGGGTGCAGFGGCGTVFKMVEKKVSTLYKFAGSPNDGAESGFGSLVEDSAGNLYGTTVYGGSGACSQSGSPDGCGTVFVVKGKKETVIHNFTGQPNDGQTPTAGLVMDSAGNLYGVTNYGGSGAGAMGAGVLFKIDKSGTETVLYNFCTVGECTDGAVPQGGLVMASGNLYGTTAFGGTVFQGGTVFKYDVASGKYTTLYNFCSKAACKDGSEPFAGLIIDAKGNLYGTTFSGGAFGEGTVFELSASGKQTVWHSFGAKNDGTNPEGGALFMDAQGNLYGTTLAGGTSHACQSGCGTVFKLAASHKETVLHSFTEKKPDGAEPAGALIMDSKGNLYDTTAGGGDFGHGIIFELTP
jgi:uncharacterized repeat protein (TIGR03803 family)